MSDTKEYIEKEASNNLKGIQSSWWSRNVDYSLPGLAIIAILGGVSILLSYYDLYSGLGFERNTIEKSFYLAIYLINLAMNFIMIRLTLKSVGMWDELLNMVFRQSPQPCETETKSGITILILLLLWGIWIYSLYLHLVPTLT